MGAGQQRAEQFEFLGGRHSWFFGEQRKTTHPPGAQILRRSSLAPGRGHPS